MDTLEEIPFTYVGPVIKADLARKLDVFDRNGKDWRGLADLLDFTADEIEVRIIGVQIGASRDLVMLRINSVFNECLDFWAKKKQP